jgi:hypothetical protein
MTTKEERDAMLLSVAKRKGVIAESKHPGGSSYCGEDLAVGNFIHPEDPSRNREGVVLDWNPNEKKSQAGKLFNRRTLQMYSNIQTRIDEKWIPLVAGPTEGWDEERKMTLRNAVTKMKEESPLEMIPMSVKTYVRWDGEREFKIEGQQPAFMPNDLEILTGASERAHTNIHLEMGMQSLQMAELMINGTAQTMYEAQIKKRAEPLIGFQVPRTTPISLGDTSTGKVLSEELKFESKAMEARTAVKLHSIWEVKQVMVVKEHQLEDPDLGTYKIPVLHIETIIAKTHVGYDVEIEVELIPDVIEVNALWREILWAVAGKAMREVAAATNELWKYLVWNEEDKKMPKERWERVSNIVDSEVWNREFQRKMNAETGEYRAATKELNLIDFLRADRTSNKDITGDYSAMPIAQMLVLEWIKRQEQNSKPASKRSAEEEQSGPNKKQRSGHEKLLEEGSVEEAKGVARGSFDGRSSA